MDPMSFDENEIQKSILENLMTGTLEQHEGGYRLTEKGNQETEDMLKYSVDAMQIIFGLTLADLEPTLSEKQMAILLAAFDVAVTQSQAKDTLILNLMEKCGIDPARTE